MNIFDNRTEKQKAALRTAAIAGLVRDIAISRGGTGYLRGKKKEASKFNKQVKEVMQQLKDASLALTRKDIRQKVKDSQSTIGKIGASKFAGMKSRKERRKEQGKDFVPQYN